MSFSKAPRDVVPKSHQSSRYIEIRNNPLQNKNLNIPNNSHKNERNSVSLDKNKPTSLSRSSSAPNKELSKISPRQSDNYFNSKTGDLKDFGFPLGNRSTELNVKNSHKYSTNHFSDFHEEPIKNQSINTNELNWPNESKMNSNSSGYRDLIGNTAKYKSNADGDKYFDREFGSRQIDRFHVDKHIYSPHQYSPLRNKYFENVDNHIYSYPSNSAHRYGNMATRNDDYQSRNRDIYRELDTHKIDIEKLRENDNLKQARFDLETKNKNLSFQLDKCLTENNLHQNFDDYKAKLKHSHEKNEQLETIIHSKSQIDSRRCENCAELIKQLENEKAKFKRKIDQIDKIAKDYQIKMEDSNNSTRKLELELNQCEYRCKSLQNEYDHIKSRYSTEKEQLVSALKESERTNQKLQQDLDNCKAKLRNSQTNENEKVKTKFDQFENIAKSYQLKMEDSNRSIKGLKLELNQLESKYKSLENEKNQYLEQINRLKSKLNDSDGKNKLLYQDFEDYKAKFKSLQERNSQLKSTNQSDYQLDRIRCGNCAEFIKQLENEKARVKRKIDQIVNDYQIKMNDSNNSIRKLKLELNQWENQCKSLQNENDHIKSQYSTEREQLESIIKEIDNKNKILQNKYDECNLKFNQSERDKELEAKYENLELEYYKLLKENEKLKSSLKEIDAEKQILHDSYDKFKMKSIQLEKHNENLEQKYSHLQTENEKLQLESNKLMRENEILKSTIKENSNKNKILQNMNEINQSDKLQRDLEQKYSHLGKENEYLQSEYNKLIAEMEKLKSTIKEINGENKILQNRNDEIQAETKRANDKNKKLQSALNDVLIENEKLNLQINNAQIYSNSNIKSNYPPLSQESYQTKSESPLKINYSDNHKKGFEEENDNLEQQESEFIHATDGIGESRSHRKRKNKSPRSLSQTIPNSNMSNIKPFINQEKFMREPIGFENPKGFCFLNCIIQQLYSCTEFKNELIQYHRRDSIATDQSNPQASDDDKIFVNNFCKLMEEIDNRNDKKIRELVFEIQKYFIQSSSGDDVLKCFMTVLTILSNVTKVKKLNRNSSVRNLNYKVSFENFKNQNDGLVFRSFYGQMILYLVCKNCEYSMNTSFQLFKSVALPVPESRGAMKLEEIIKIFLQKSPVEVDDKRDCKCPNGSLNCYSITEYTHMPLYLFIYLNRGSFYRNGPKNNTHVTCGNYLDFPIKDGSTKYKLISVIEHIGDNLGGHYYAKSCFETDQWWMLNDSSVHRISDNKNIATENTIVFLFKRISNEN